LALQTPKFYLAGSKRARKSGFLRSIVRKNPQFEQALREPLIKSSIANRAHFCFAKTGLSAPIWPLCGQIPLQYAPSGRLPIGIDLMGAIAPGVIPCAFRLRMPSLSLISASLAVV
jgi:hypothetical protein